MAESAAVCCSHCGKEGGLKRCSRCKQVSYCGADCQKAAWKEHGPLCAPTISIHGFLDKIQAMEQAKDWRGILEWEGSVEYLMESQPDLMDTEPALISAMLMIFVRARASAIKSTGSAHHAPALLKLRLRQIELLGKTESWLEQGEAMCHTAGVLSALGRQQEAMEYYERVRKLGTEHGFFVLEYGACSGLGEMAVNEGREEEGLDLLRHALVYLTLRPKPQTLATRAGLPHTLNPNPSTLNPKPRPQTLNQAAAPLSERNPKIHELEALWTLLVCQFQTRRIDEDVVEPLVARLRVAGCPPALL